MSLVERIRQGPRLSAEACKDLALAEMLARPPLQDTLNVDVTVGGEGIVDLVPLTRRPGGCPHGRKRPSRGR